MSEAKNVVSMVSSLPQDQKYYPTVETFRTILEERLSKYLRFNVWNNRPEICKEGKWCWLQDADEANMRNWFQINYGISNRNNFQDALSIFLDQNKVNPLTEQLNALKWDGKNRISSFLADIMKCNDSPAVREISRLIFAGGIHRAYNPGCKFDHMPVLIGKQGCGKSTIVEWLGMGHSGRISTFSGNVAIESLFGVWIGEVDELSAMKRAKDREETKAFLSATNDKYRFPYDKHTQQIPRKCIFIGTTNSRNFLNDPTGNRRFFPVEVHSSASELYVHEAEVKEHIRQCWAEAVSLFNEGNLNRDYDHRFDEAFNQMRAAVSAEDADASLIEAYLNTKSEGDYVYGRQLWLDACGHDPEKYGNSNAQRIGDIMDNMKGWKRLEEKHYFGPRIGTQRAWKKIGQE